MTAVLRFRVSPAATFELPLVDGETVAELKLRVSKAFLGRWRAAGWRRVLMW
jgi:hypothetical protein